MTDFVPSVSSEEISVQQLGEPIYQARGWLKLLDILYYRRGNASFVHRRHSRCMAAYLDQQLFVLGEKQ